MKRFLLVAVVGLLLGVSGYADPIYTVSIPGGGTQTSGTPVSESIGSALPNPSSQTWVFEQALAGPNEIGVLADTAAYAVGVDSNGVGNFVASGAGAYAQFQDSLYLAGSPDTGILALKVNVSGLGFTQSQNLGFASGFLGVYGGSDLPTPPSGSCVVFAFGGDSGASDCGSVVGAINLLNVPYVLQAGDTAPLSLSFEADDECATQASGDNGYLVGSCSALLEYIDTAEITSIVVEDSSGNPVPGATATSLNGIDYNLPPSTIPEPGSIVLLASGLVGVARLIKRNAGRQIGTM
jgi:hypothetical protein